MSEIPLQIDAAKYAPPGLRQVLQRERLYHRLGDADDCRMVIVEGQAAQGKSTLVAEYLRQRSCPFAWLNLDAADGDPANFLHLLLHAVGQSLPLQDGGIPWGPPDIVLGPVDQGQRIVSHLRKIWRRFDQSFSIVLDGLDRVDVNAPTMRVVRSLARISDQPVRLFIVSRELPPIKIHRGLLKQEVLVLDNDELAFSEAEIQDYVQMRHGLDLTAQDTRQLRRITGGWVGALVLISQALDRLPRERWPDFLSRRLPSRFTADTVQFFSEEIFSALPQDLRDFLMHSAVLDRLNPDVLSQLIVPGDAEALLEELTRRNLFVQRLDGRSQTIYRYNRLFQDFLRSLFEKTVSRPDRQKFYRKAGDLYFKQRMSEIAIGFYSRCGDHHKVVEGLKKIGMDFLARGRLADLAGHLALLPEEIIEQDPWLLFYLTATRRIKGGMRNLSDFAKALEGFSQSGDLRGQLLGLAYLIEAHVFLGQDPGVCLDLIERAQTLLADCRHDPLYTYAKTALWLQIGLGYITNGTHVAKGISAGRNAHLLAKNMNNAALLGAAAVVRALGYTVCGEFDQADDVLARIGSWLDTETVPEYGVLRAIVDLELCLGRGNLDDAQARIEDISRSIDDFGLLFLYPTVIDASGRLKVYQGGFPDATQIARHLLDLSSMSANPVSRGLGQRLLALTHYHQGRFQDALGPAQRAVSDLSRMGHETLHLMQAKLLLGLVLLQLSHYEQAQKMIGETTDFFHQVGAHLGLFETFLAMGLLSAATGRTELSRRYLGRGFGEAANRGYRHTQLLRFSDLDRACQLARDRIDNPGRSWVAAWLEQHPMASPDTGAGVSGTPVSIRGTTRLPLLQVRTFGGFQLVPEGGLPMANKAWAGNRTQLLLKAIVVHGLREIPKELLIDNLWPESTVRAAAQNFKVTLHRLRKVIEPRLGRGQGSAYIHLKDNRISLDKDLWQVDSADFLGDCKDIKRQLIDGDTDGLLDLAKRVMRAYRGDFLPEEPYAPWVEMKRWALREEFLVVMTRVAERLTSRGRWKDATDCSQAVLQVDACREAAARCLMTAYGAQSQSGQAIQVYMSLNRALGDELGETPDPATETLYRQIRDGHSPFRN